MTYPTHTQTPALQRILALIKRGTALPAEAIAERAFVSLTTLRNGGYLAALCKAGLIHVCGWQTAADGHQQWLYAPGPQPEASTTPGVARNAARLDAIFTLLQRHGPQTYREIAARLGLTAIVVKNARYMSLLVAAKRAHIVAWRRSRPGPMQAVYAAGPGRNAPRPQPLSAAERSRRSRQIRRILVTPPPGLGAQLQHLSRQTVVSRTAT